VSGHGGCFVRGLFIDAISTTYVDMRHFQNDYDRMDGSGRSQFKAQYKYLAGETQEALIRLVGFGAEA
jgi:hypothetical protein